MLFPLFGGFESAFQQEKKSKPKIRGHLPNKVSFKATYAVVTGYVVELTQWLTDLKQHKLSWLASVEGNTRLRWF
jgi:hypothetical protein